MSQTTLRKNVPDLAAWECEIQRRLLRGKTRLMITHGLLFILAVSAMLFVL